MSTAREALDAALLDMAARGDKPRCAWPDLAPLFVSDDHDDRARAARRCWGCPVHAQCGAAADETGETFGVWAGIDRTRRPNQRTKGTSA